MRFALVILLFAAGVAASLSLTQAHADAVTLQDLPGLGYTLVLRFDVPTGCGNYVVVSGNGASETLIGDPVHDWCQLPGAIAARIAALIALYPPVSSTAAPVTVTVTTSETTTLAAPSVTVTVPVTSTELVTTTATLERTITEPTTVETTVERTVGAAPVTTTIVRTETIAPAVTVAAPDVLNVDGASAQAFAAAVQAGADGAAAALAARSAGLNVALGLA